MRKLEVFDCVVQRGFHPSKILKKYCTWKRNLRDIYSNSWWINTVWHLKCLCTSPFFATVPVRGKWQLSHRLMFNKEAFVQTTDQEFSWTMTHDGSGPLPAKQWFCFKFLCHSCFSKTSVIWGCPGPQGAIMRLDMALESRKVSFSLNVRYLFMQGLRVSS